MGNWVERVFECHDKTFLKNEKRKDFFPEAFAFLRSIAARIGFCGRTKRKSQFGLSINETLKQKTRS